jgi:DNA-directed RNA polymerase specialized sigma24 family protein
MSDVTRILSQIESGDPSAAEQLLPLVYDELRKLAAAKLAHEKPGQTLQATALVHEAYMRLVGSDRRAETGGTKRNGIGQSGPAEGDGTYSSRGHFFAAAAEAMRRILVENARRKGRSKHGGGHRRVELGPAQIAVNMPADHLLSLDEALTRLSEHDPVMARLVTLHCFAGLSIEQAAEALGISSRTAYRDWAFAQAWLYREIRGLEPLPD